MRGCEYRVGFEGFLFAGEKKGGENIPLRNEMNM